MHRAVPRRLPFVVKNTTSGNEQEDTSSPQLAQSLLRHVNANAIADYYDISKLTELTRSKIQQTQLIQWDPDAWLNATKNALFITGDRTCHDILAQTIAHNASNFLVMDQLDEVMNNFSIRVFRHRVQAAETDERLLRLQILELKKELEVEQTRRGLAEAKTHRVIENMRNCVEISRERDICRNSSCHTSFNCYIEERGQIHEPLFTIRCTKCRCKH